MNTPSPILHPDRTSKVLVVLGAANSVLDSGAGAFLVAQVAK